MTQKFKYKALTATGEKVADYLFATDEQAARAALKHQPLTVISVSLENSSGFLPSKAKASAADVEQSTNQLATLLENGLRINDALEILVDTAPSQALAAVWQAVFTSVQGGTSLYNALQEYPELFDVLYLEMTNIAENTGTLPKVFRSLADNLAFQRDLKSKTIQALIYPMIIFMVCVSAIFAIFNFVIPNMESVFASAKNLPSYTQWLLDTSHFISENNFLILFSIVGFIMSIVVLWSQETTRHTALNVISKMPLIGALFDKAEQIRFCSAMSLTLQSGLNLSDSLLLSIKTLSSTKNKQQLEYARVNVDTGAPLVTSLERSHFLDRMSLSLIKVGEQSGTLDRSFIEVTKRAKSEFETWMMKMTALLEPLLIMVMGAIVGGVVVVMLLSIVSVNDLSL
jgi:type II secretory pathway component PulF